MRQLPPNHWDSEENGGGRRRGGPLSRPQYIDYAEMEPDNDSSGGLLEYWTIVKRHKTTVIVAAALGLVAAILYTLPQTPVYQARTTVEIQGLNEEFLNMKNINPNSNSNSYYPEYDINTHVRLLQSATLLDRVTEKLKAQKKESVVREGRIAIWRKLVGLGPSESESPRDAAIGMAAGTLKIRAQANTRLLDISSDSSDPQAAADYVNQLTTEFIDQSLEARLASSQTTGDWLTRQLEETKIKLEKSEDALHNYARQTGLVFTQEKGNVTEDKLRQVQDELTRARAERFSKQSRYELALKAPIESLAEVLENASLTDIRNKLTDLRRQNAELSSAFTPEHRQVRRVQAQIAELESVLQTERSRIIGRIQSDYESAERRELLLAKEYASHEKLMTNQGDKVGHYNILKREVDTNRQIYDVMLQRVKEASIASALRASNVRIVDPAKAPKAPYKPNLRTNAALGLLSGFFLGVVFVIFRERADRAIQKPGDATLYIGVPELGTVPSAGAEKRRSRRLLPGLGGDNNQALERGVAQQHDSLMAEAFRMTVASILFTADRSRAPRVLLMSSGAPQEGKTTVCANLAIALAEIHKKVLLIDADTRRPRMHNIFALNNDEGLVDLLRRPDPIAALNGEIQTTDIRNLDVLTSGPSKDSDPRLFYSNRLSELLEVARKSYDIILIDTPPMLAMADARGIARQADAVLLVARVNQTSRDALRDAYQRFTEDGTPVMGTVLNDWDPKTSTRYGYTGYSVETGSR